LIAGAIPNRLMSWRMITSPEPFSVQQRSAAMFLDDARIGEVALTPIAAMVVLLLHLISSSFALSRAD